MNQILQQATKMVFPWVATIAMHALKTVVNYAWVTFWQTILGGIKDAEKRFTTGLVKKDWVIKVVIDFVNKKRVERKKKPMNAIQTKAVKVVIGKAIDIIITELNNHPDKNWGDAVIDIEKVLNDKIKFIEPATLT